MTKRRRVLCVVAREEYFRNYLTTDAMEQLEAECECYYVQSDRISGTEVLGKKPGWLGTYHFTPEAERAHYSIFNVLMYRYRSLSSAFRFRIMRVTRAPSWSSGRSAGSLFRRTLRQVYHIARAWKVRSSLRILASDLCYPLYRKRVMDRLPVNQDIVNAIERVRPDLVIFPSSAYDPDGTDLSRACSAARIKSLFLVDNWDNLSSKSIMWAQPDYLAVWGEQSREHAEQIQGVSAKNVALVGTPRFDTYFRARDRRLRSHFDFPYVLFVGTALAFDEAGALRILNETIDRHPDVFGDAKIVYRPHPRRQGTDSIIGLDLKHVVIDPQLERAYASGALTVSAMPDLDYYPALIQNAELVAGGLTSMLIEALIFTKRFLALVYDDGANLTSQHNALRYYPHFAGIEQISALDFCRNVNDLDQDFLRAWRKRHDIDRAETDTQRSYYLYADSRPYKRRLAEVVEDIFEERDFRDRELTPVAEP